MKTDRSFLNDVLLVNEELHNTLVSRSIGVNNISSVNENNDVVTSTNEVKEKGVSLSKSTNNINKPLGVYLVMFKVLNNNSNILVYNYVYYPYVFTDYILGYFISKADFKKGITIEEWGDYFTFIDEELGYSEKAHVLKTKFAAFNEYLIDMPEYTGNIKDYLILLNILKKLTFVCNVNRMASSVRLAFNSSYYEFFSEFENLFDFYNKHWGYVGHGPAVSYFHYRNEILKTFVPQYFVFVVKDLVSLLSSMENKGFSVNQGPQSFRGRVNSISHELTCIDFDIRKSLYNHYQNHINKKNISVTSNLKRECFSFKNIHNRIGGTRFYSTRSIKNSNNINNVNNREQNKSIKEGSDLFDRLNIFLVNSPINDETQRKLERYLLEYSYFSLSDKNKDSSLINYNLISKELVYSFNEGKEKINNYLNNFKKRSFDKLTSLKNKKIKNNHYYYFNNMIKVVNNDYVISIILGRLMRIISSYNKYNDYNNVASVCNDLVNELIRKYYYELYIKSKEEKKDSIDNTYSMSHWREDNQELINLYNDSIIKGEIGSIIIDWMRQADLVSINLVKNNKEFQNRVVPSTNISGYIDNKSTKLMYLPLKIPMIVKPKKYYKDKHNRDVLGGYLLNDELCWDTLIIDNWELKELSTIKDKNVTYDLVNNMNSVSYKINTQVLDFIINEGYRYNMLIDSSSIHPSLKLKSKLTKHEEKKLQSYLSNLELQENILGLAKLFSEIPEFYLPVRIDNRGRMYCISEYLHYQSNELSKSLLLFSKGEKIFRNDTKAIEFLKAFGTNCFGNKLEKKSWVERIKWIDDNQNDIINFRNGVLLHKSENKLLFLAFCFEYNKLLEWYNGDSLYFETHLPIQLDATCNGYQHLSLLSSDSALAKELNLTKSNWNDTPKDFYTYLCTKLVDLFRNKLNSPHLSETELESLTRLSNFSINRSIIKKAVMTIPYNVSTQEMVKYIKDQFECENTEDNSINKYYILINDNGIKLKHMDFYLLAKGLREILSLSFPKLNYLSEYLKKIAHISAKLDLVIPWTTPSGVIVKQSYLASNEVRLKPFAYDKSSFILRITDKNKLNHNKQRRALMPNLIHSLDAASLALLVDHYFSNTIPSSIKNMYAVHDCFAVTSNNVSYIMSFLKVVYTNIYSDAKYLKQFDNEIIHQIKSYYGEACFDYDNRIIKVNDMKIKYPDINVVLGKNLDFDSLNESNYLIN